MMRKNDTPADPELHHICLSLKNHLFHRPGAGRHHVHAKYPGDVKMTNLSLRSLMEGELRLSSCLLTFLGVAGPSHSLLQAASPSPAQWDWLCYDPKQPISVSPERIHYTETMLPLISLCRTWMAPVCQGPSEEMVRGLGQFLLSKHKIRTMFLWGHESMICLLNEVGLYTNNESILTTKLTDFNVFPCSP